MMDVLVEMISRLEARDIELQAQVHSCPQKVADCRADSMTAAASGQLTVKGPMSVVGPLRPAGSSRALACI